MSDARRETATIYDLTERLKRLGHGMRRKVHPASPAKPAAPVLSSECWYHEAAMREAADERKS